MKLLHTQWNYPTTIWFGAGRSNDLPLSCQKTGIKKPLLVTDNGLVKLDIVENAKRVLKEAGIDFTVYSDVQGNPTEANVLNGVAHYTKNRHDGVIAFGGGSAMDAAKAIAFM
uniref:iron-containing alcohol dehydrogenase n=1 Tax=Pricia sp. TaxID=2268138 RepID=UPI00359341A0